jgi:hypothetical protein
MKKITIDIDQQTAETFGKKFILGCLYSLIQFLVGVVIVLAIYSYFIQPVDSCDESRWKRCGLKVVTDAGTGKQYLVSPGGGIIERATTKE